MRDFQQIRIEPFSEPEGTTSWVARRYVLQGTEYAGRYILRWFDTKAEGEEWLAAHRSAAPLLQEQE